jgi:hypothetical protein
MIDAAHQSIAERCERRAAEELRAMFEAHLRPVPLLVRWSPRLRRGLVELRRTAHLLSAHLFALAAAQAKGDAR